MADREQYASDEEMMAQYTKTIGKVRRRRDIKEKLAAAEKNEQEIDQVIVAGGDRIESKKQDNKELKEDKKELIEENKQLKQQLFKAREKKLGRALTEKEKEEILKNIQQTK